MLSSFLPTPKTEPSPLLSDIFKALLFVATKSGHSWLKWMFSFRSWTNHFKLLEPN